MLLESQVIKLGGLLFHAIVHFLRVCHGGAYKMAAALLETNSYKLIHKVSLSHFAYLAFLKLRVLS